MKIQQLLGGGLLLGLAVSSQAQLHVRPKPGPSPDLRLSREPDHKQRNALLKRDIARLEHERRLLLRRVMPTDVRVIGLEVQIRWMRRMLRHPDSRPKGQLLAL